ncbi:DUF7668 domain-containing protein [Janthinobacterium sp. B9-8]|uniref:DUF7668 domain-containing protein n=1 Tax=Janthinobacterium sp. B9-8 TaxID=1236179 RepID=UPI00061D3808|nr:hypothetical protein [Janthinobacterium sp. B9-8]
MSNVVSVLKDKHGQQPVPSAWRNTFSEIVEAFKDKDFTLARGIACVRPISVEDAEGIADNIQNYGALLISLPEEAWQTSVCQWQEGHWSVMVDLFTESEGASDLVLHVRVYENGSAFVFEVHLVYVP